MPAEPPGAPRPANRTRAILTVILIAAALIRFYASATRPLISDESVLAIELADRISFSWDHAYLPIRGLHHPALPLYLIRGSAELFGFTVAGYRALSVFGGVVSILLMFMVAKQLFGPVAGLWTAALLAFNEYHVIVSSLATAKGPHLFFVSVAIYAFVRFLDTDRPGSLYGCAAATALAYYCKEHSVLLPVAAFLTLFIPRHRQWLRRWTPYLAAALFVVLILPDVYMNLTSHPNPQPLVAGTGPATYHQHLSRIGGIGLSPYPALFFARDSLMWLSARIFDVPLVDLTFEYPAMNAAFGVLLVGAVIAGSRRPANGGAGFLVILFWVVFGFFSLVRPAQPTNGMDPVTWYWVDAVIFPAVILAGSALARVTGPGGIGLRTATALAMIFAFVRMAAFY